MLLRDPVPCSGRRTSFGRRLLGDSRGTFPFGRRADSGLPTPRRTDMRARCRAVGRGAARRRGPWSLLISSRDFCFALTTHVVATGGLLARWLDGARIDCPEAKYFWVGRLAR